METTEVLQQEQPQTAENLPSNSAETAEGIIKDVAAPSVPVEPAAEKLSSIEKRIARLTRQNKELQERLRGTTVLNNANYARQPDFGETANLPAKPDRNQFPDPHDYAEALIKFDKENSQAQAYRSAKEREAQNLKTYQENLNTQHGSRVAEFSKTAPDYFDSVKSIEGILPPSHVIAIQKSPKSAEIAYFLAKNVEEAMDFASLDVLDAAAKVGELNFKLGLQKSNQSHTPPMSPLQGSANTRIGIKDNNISALRKKFFAKRG